MRAQFRDVSARASASRALPRNSLACARNALPFKRLRFLDVVGSSARFAETVPSVGLGAASSALASRRFRRFVSALSPARSSARFGARGDAVGLPEIAPTQTPALAL